MQAIVADLLGLGLAVEIVAAELTLTVAGVRRHVKGAAAKIPSDLPAQMRVIAWARGATQDVLQGTSLKVEIVNTANRPPHSGTTVQLTGRQ